jgi:hypothetical protein
MFVLHSCKTNYIFFNTGVMNPKSLLLPLLLLVGCIPVDQIGSVNIDTTCNLCIVEGEINGKKTYFLMDTGAGLTTVDINQAKHFGFTSTPSDLSVSGFNNNVAAIEQAVGITSIKIKEVDITGDIIYTTNMSNLVKHIQQCANKRISGIIGVPIIKRHRLVIDLTNNKLYKN